MQGTNEGGKGIEKQRQESRTKVGGASMSCASGPCGLRGGARSCVEASRGGYFVPLRVFAVGVTFGRDATAMMAMMAS